MDKNFTLKTDDNSPLYKQLVRNVISAIRSGKLKPGQSLPSMNELAEQLNVSKETVKKAYSILRDTEYITAIQGKGVFVNSPESRQGVRILFLFDKLSAYKEITFNAFVSRIGDKAQCILRFHNQSVDLLRYYLDESLDRYDYYVIAPNFPLDDETQAEVRRQMIRVPYRKLIMVDNWISSVKGNYGAVYQDFEHDVCGVLSGVLEDLRKYRKLNVVTLPSSLYHKPITQSLKSFCKKNGIKAEFHNGLTNASIRKNEVYLLLNGQLTSELNNIAKLSAENKLYIGKDIAIISYNETSICELVLGGLTTVSADFEKMGTLAAQMILDKEMKKIKCDFNIIRRATF